MRDSTGKSGGIREATKSAAKLVVATIPAGEGLVPHPDARKMKIINSQTMRDRMAGGPNMKSSFMKLPKGFKPNNFLSLSGIECAAPDRQRTWQAHAGCAQTPPA